MAESAPDTAPKKKSDLPTRLGTALVLAAILIAVLLSGSIYAWVALASTFCVIAAWEGARLAARPAIALQLALTVALIAFVGYEMLKPSPEALVPIALLTVAVVFWVIVAPLQLSRRSIDVSSVSGRVCLALVIAAAWVGAIALFRYSAMLLVAVIVLTVAADVAAYFVGRRFGRVKLAPAISPGKSREGAIAGLVAGGAVAFGGAMYFAGYRDIALLLISPIAGGFLAVLSIIGDLWESQLKRQAGVKDSSNLLPGHGGFLDRIDAHLAVIPAATLTLSAVVPLWR